MTLASVESNHRQQRSQTDSDMSRTAAQSGLAYPVMTNESPLRPDSPTPSRAPSAYDRIRVAGRRRPLARVKGEMVSRAPPRQAWF
jgi:hypothetical protein